MSTPPSHLRNFQHTLPPHQGYLLSRPSDLRYFFRLDVPIEHRAAFGLVTSATSLLLHSPLITVPSQPPTVSLHNSLLEPAWQHAARYLQNAGVQTLSYDAADLRVSELRQFKKILKVRLQPQARQRIWNLRMVKDEMELKLMRRAGSIAARALSQLQHELAPGMTEAAAARHLDTIMFDLGADTPAFPTIVAFGPHTAIPHHLPTQTKLTPETPVLIDCGAKFHGYCSDMTRTWWFGTKSSRKFKSIEMIITNAYAAGLRLLSSSFAVASFTDIGASKLLSQLTPSSCTMRMAPSLSASAVDKVVRTVIDQAGYGNQFIHTTGHGLGLDIHEPPSQSERDTSRLQTGMVITIEPGIYLPGKFGFRLENTLSLVNQ